MKRITTLATGMFVALLGLVACQQTEERACQDVADKIQNNQELTSDDYTRMIEYVGEYAEKAQDYVVNDNSEQLQGELQRLQKEYPLVDLFRTCIANTPADKFDADNLSLLQKYGGLTEFTMPADMSISTDAKAAGLEVATPDSGVDNGVIAGGVDEEKVENR